MSRFRPPQSVYGQTAPELRAPSAGDSMLLDDRLATVLRMPAHNESAARTQYRQLLDLLGSMPRDAAGPLVEAAYERLADLAEVLPPGEQSAILRAPGLRLRSRALAAWLAAGEPQAAAAAMATAELSEADWLRLIPRLSMTARGFLRHRRDLPGAVRQVLERLGVRDLVLPEPDGQVSADPRTIEPTEAGVATDTDAQIGELVRRIEAFQRARRERSPAPQLPLGDIPLPSSEARRGAFDFATDATGEIVWADPAMAPLAVGMRLGAHGSGAIATLDPAGSRALARYLPLRGVSATLSGLPEIAGEWRIDAAPVFTQAIGAFDGYQGRMRRPATERAAPTGNSDAGDRMRQLLHELRTPVNAIQGFAELIQQQLFGYAPNEYRALAAGIAVDAARLLAGFDEVDRLAQLESGALQLEPGSSDLRDVVGQLLQRLGGVLRPRSARIELAVRGSPFIVGLEDDDIKQLAWRFLATLAGALGAGEVIDATLSSDGRRASLLVDLPTSLMVGDGELFAASVPAPPRVVSAGMFGVGFTLRLARAEAVAAGGSLEREGDAVRLALPVQAGPMANPVPGRGESERPA
ncbi:MAG: histidine kinase dimerization/phospho-acceptor domain-containing protein [Croceibacterium sp.]